MSGVVWVTGAANGVGRGLALGLARKGWKVAVNDIDEPALAGLGAELARLGPSAVVVADITDAAAVARAHDEIVGALGPVDALINNALLAVRGNVLDLDVADWRRALDVSLTGYFVCAQVVARALVARGAGGRIINLSSGAAERGIPGTAGYACAKGGVNALTRVMAVELAQHGICVNTLTTGPIMTESFAMLAADAEGVEARRRRVPMGRLGTTDDCLGVVDYLLSPAAAWTTGGLFHVDGGANNAALVQQVTQ